jgi:type IV pilus assembly protein PilP
LPAGAAWAVEQSENEVVRSKVTLPESGVRAGADTRKAADSLQTGRDGTAARLGDSPQTVRKRITLPQPVPGPAPAKPAPTQDAQADAYSKPAAAPVPSPPAASSGDSAADARTASKPPAAVDSPGPAAAGTQPLPGVLGPLAKEKEKMKVIYSYNPKGKIDPFEPLYRAKPKAVEKKKKKKRPKRVPRTPLEMVDVSQLKLSAIITAPSGNRALVEEASGKGYVIRAGTPIGIHWGKVAEIKIDRVIVEEEVENLMGDYVKRKREMKLNKPTGE